MFTNVWNRIASDGVLNLLWTVVSCFGKTPVRAMP